ncbi:gp194 [Sphingomonas phage PAU]|uniref:DNA binding protein n=1 Tax=Sphingomonas phage PAU TaxID=1150991 RepID=UPI0002573360|nr:DNA binding protein [Sphingomonas phage PAU]AFF28192.1 gp194 [Sphingomonas phage PAU]
MNIFFLDNDETISASLYTDKHIIKMITETCQMLSTYAHEKFENHPVELYKPTHRNHPCTKWLFESTNNVIRLCNIGIALVSEYHYRFGKLNNFYKAKQILHYVSFRILDCSFELGTELPCVVAEYDENLSVFENYEKYYITHKLQNAKFTNRRESELHWTNKAVTYYGQQKIKEIQQILQIPIERF